MTAPTAVDVPTVTDAQDPPPLAEAYRRAGLTELSDARLVACMAARLSRPRRDPADSFVLHAPLELVARAALLAKVRPEQRPRARLRMFALAEHFEATGPAVAETEPDAAAFDSTVAAAARLVAAVDAGDLDAVDIAARWLGRAASGAELRELLAADTVRRLSAAAHAPIFLYHLPRVAPRGEVTGELLRGLARELARYPDWRLHWVDERSPATAGSVGSSADALFEALAATPDTGPPDSPFIFPLMSAVDTSGVAEHVLGDVTRGWDVAERGRAVLRAAAWSMLLEPPDHAPYGWSHCLTLPQAVLGVADVSGDPQAALAVAATHVVGFRAALAAEPLVAELSSPDPQLALADALAAGPTVAAAAVWHGSAGTDAAIVEELATRAAVQHDAHLVKYVLACLDAAAGDPAHDRLFLAAAASLTSWWANSPNPDDPLA